MRSPNLHLSSLIPHHLLQSVRSFGFQPSAAVAARLESKGCHYSETCCMQTMETRSNRLSDIIKLSLWCYQTSLSFTSFHQAIFPNIFLCKLLNTHTPHTYILVFLCEDCHSTLYSSVPLPKHPNDALTTSLAHPNPPSLPSTGTS